MKILAVGGGSGGHVTPVLAVINELQQKDPDLQVWFVCDKAFESQSRGIMGSANVPVMVSTIIAGKFRRYAHLSQIQHMTNMHIMSRNLIDIFKIAIGFFQSLFLIARIRPDVVFAKGGYVCLPVGLAARLLGRPLVIHDSDARPGLTNRVLARYATSIATGSPLENYHYDSRKTRYTGVPIARNFAPVDEQEQRRYKQLIGINPDLPLIVATGGGLGARSINLALAKAGRALSARDFAIYHITGKRHYDEIMPLVKDIPQYVAVPFVYEKMHEVLGAADVVVSRASATFLQELAGLGKAVVAVPARQLGDQLKNAEVYKAADAAIVMTDDEIASGTNFEDVIVGLIENAEFRKKLGKKLHTFARPDAASQVADVIIKAVK
ncbi:MAG TPA: UDP-N-acetylglucosamine--N-acetylmuramyl-(pentapeptide) pyrophosphoryl-undecaprenol N-acetylglucosamine transferase [Candidatus Saccharimonadales bacterium]|jgi:UDP-N-acetylglucosamine--N-acetylmuramyl-(pentapeptide) pyrophosphoryl-undecaprenol N-acetylglucosamine transferase|nr:UDP-N-acetylglucosamine--N-acetylmuramyl-(pentapeptide) pyrophosphoryl-undecaprenol N-acetylglucosamine transferase [Candidatus Saccharimonadales bacterium]